MTEAAAREVSKTVTQRGFTLVKIPFRDYRGYPERVMEVQSSSLASERKLWVGPNVVQLAVPGVSDDPILMERAHLGEDEVRELRDALTEWLGDGDARQEPKTGG